jgi:hypothetical protein
MDSVIFDGVEYVKAAVAAKKFKYTSDYVGQLCRAKKVDARLVGRTWFVSTDSLVVHKQNKHNKAPKNSPVEPTKSESTSVAIKTSPTKVSPVIKSKTFKAFARQADNLPVKTERTLHVAYERDEENLMPTIVRKHTPPPQEIQVNNAGAKKVRIKGGNKQTSYSPNEIPSFALSGKVRVDPLHEADEAIAPKEDVKKPKNIAISEDAKKTTSKITIHKSKKVTNFITPEKKVSIEELSRAREAASKKAANTQIQTSVSQEGSEAVSFTPKTIEQSMHSNHDEYDQPQASRMVLLSPLFATITAALLFVLMFSVSAEVQVSGESYTSTVTISMQNFLDIFSR